MGPVGYGRRQTPQKSAEERRAEARARAERAYVSYRDRGVGANLALDACDPQEAASLDPVADLIRFEARYQQYAANEARAASARIEAARAAGRIVRLPEHRQGDLLQQVSA